MRRTLVLAITLTALLVHSAAAQDSTASCSFDTTARLRIDTVVIGLAPGPRIGNKPELRDEYLVAAAAIQSFYQPPARLSLPLWARTFGGSGSHPGAPDAKYGFDGEVRFQLDDNGRLIGDSVHIETLHGDFAESVATAIRRADSALAFTPPSRSVRRDHGMIRLHFAGASKGKLDGVMLLRVAVPAVRVDKAPEVASIRRLQYPDNLRYAGISGRITLQFVLREDGHPDQSTLSVVEAQYREFVMEAIKAISTATFKPAKIGACAVPTLVRVPVDFRIRS